MNIQVGNREKIASIVVVCLITIAAFHYFLVMGKAARYRNTHNDYLSKRQEWASMVNPQSSAAIEEFIKQNEAMTTYVKQLAENLNVKWDEMFFDMSTTSGIEKRQQRVIDLVGEFCDLRIKHKIRLRFLDPLVTINIQNVPQNLPGWDIPMQLPPRISLWDEVKRLQAASDLLDSLSDPNMYLAFLFQRYEPVLRALGIEPNTLRMLEFQGQFVPTIKRMAHARLIWAQKLRDEQAGRKPPLDSLKQLYEMLKIKLSDNPDALFLQIKQMEFLIRLVKLADENKVDDIYLVNLMLARRVDEVTDPSGQKRLVSEVHHDQMPFGAGFTRPAAAAPWAPTEPGMMEEGVPVEGGAAMGPVPGAAAVPGAVPAPGVAPELAPGVMPGMPVPGAPTPKVTPMTPAALFEPTPTPPPIAVGQWIGTAVPIRIGFTASWDVAMEYLYAMSHNQNPFELDSVVVRGGQAGKVMVEATVAPMAWVEGVQAFYAPPTTATLTTATIAAALMPAPGSLVPASAPTSPSSGPVSAGPPVVAPPLGAPVLNPPTP